MNARLLLVLGASMLVSLPYVQAGAAETEREYIYGAELMTPQERDAYRRGLQRAPEGSARDGYRRQHRERLQQRAQRRGQQLDERGIVRRQEQVQ